MPLRQVTSSYQSIIDLGKSQSPDGAFIPNDTDPSIVAGYQAQRALILDLYAANSTSALEYAFSDGAVLPLTIVKPLSRGTIYINSTDPLDPPQADWNAFSDPVDLEILIAGVRILRDLMATEAMTELGPTELAPGASLTTDKDIGEALRQQAQPTYLHLTSTCSMMKREYGGVVDPSLQVYGVEGLSVVDSSIMPLIPTAHTMATVYAVAEKVCLIFSALFALSFGPLFLPSLFALWPPPLCLLLFSLITKSPFYIYIYIFFPFPSLSPFNIPQVLPKFEKNNKNFKHQKEPPFKNPNLLQLPKLTQKTRQQTSSNCATYKNKAESKRSTIIRGVLTSRQ